MRLSVTIVLSVVAVAVVGLSSHVKYCLGFQIKQHLPVSSLRRGLGLPKQQSTTTDAVILQMGLFDGFIKSMESGYSGGEESPYAKKIAAEEKKRKEFEQKKREERKARGYKEFKDYDPKTQKTFAKAKYDDGSNDKKKKNDISKRVKEAPKANFKFPWDK